MRRFDEIETNSVLKVIESTLITVAASFPIASSIAAGWNEYKNYVQEKNVREIIDYFLSRLKEMEDVVDFRFIESIEMKQLILKTCFVGKEELIEEKRRYFGSFLANSCSIEHSCDSCKDSVLDTLSRLNPYHINIMTFLPYSEGEIFKNSITYRPEEGIINKFGAENSDITTTALWYLLSLGVIQSDASRLSPFTIYDFVEIERLKEKLDKLKIIKTEIYKPKIFETETAKINREIEETEILFDKCIKKLVENSRGHALTILGYKVLKYIGIEIKLCP